MTGYCLRTRAGAQAARHRASTDEAGFTLVELLVAMTIFAVVLSMIFAILINVTRYTKDNLARTRAVDQARIGLMQIDREVRSGNVISDPAAETAAASGVAPYYSLRVYTQTDGVYQCVQWRVRFPAGSAFGLLEYRSWQPSWQTTGGVSAWSTVARDVVQPTGTFSQTDQTSWPPFFVESSDAEASSVAQTIRVTLRVKSPEQSAPSKPESLTTVLTGRNTVFGYPADSCAAVPPL